MNLINFNLISLMLSALIVLPIIIAETLRLLGNHTKQKLVEHFGVSSQVILGGLGVIIHELAHLITSVIFLHQIGRFKLLEPRNYQLTGTLGYVNHYWNRHNFYESLGNFFIGLAPCYFCSEVLWLIHGYLFNNQSINYSFSNNLNGAIQAAYANVAHPFGPVSWKLLIYIILIVTVASTGYGLSNADLKNSWSGLGDWIILVVIFYLLIILLGDSVSFTQLLWQLTVLWLTFLGRGLIYLVTSLIVIDIIGIF